MPHKIALRISVIIIFCCISACYPAVAPKGDPDRITESIPHNKSGGCIMRKYTVEEIRNFALQRAGKIGPEVQPVGYLVIKHWKGSVRYKYHTVWSVRNINIDPSTDRLIAVDESGNTLFLNSYYNSSDLFRFWQSEDIGSRFADNPKLMVKILLELHDYYVKLLDSLTDIEDLKEDEYRRVSRRKSEFFTPRVRRENGFIRMDFWTWSHSTGHLERWKAEFGKADIKFDREVIEEHIGSFLPNL